MQSSEGLRKRGSRIRSFFGSAALAFLAMPALAVDHVWNVPTGDWNTPASWNPASVPGASDRNYIGNGNVATISADVPVTSQVYIGGVTDNGQNLPGPGTLNQTAGTLTLRNNATPAENA